MGQNHRIAEIKGLSDEMQEKLADLGIATAYDLLARAGGASGRAQLARELGVETREVTEWVNRADLMRLTGVGTEMANLLEECGVDSCKELQHRVAGNLHAKLKQTNDELKITHHAPSLAQVEAWITEAKTLALEDFADGALAASGRWTHRVAEIKGLGDEMKEQLHSRGITTVDDLLARAGAASDRARLARELGIEPSQITEWVNRADLMRLTGVGTEMANLLEESGVDSCKELQHRVPEHLHAKLKETNDEKKITHHTPSLDQVTAWIAEARTLVLRDAADRESTPAAPPTAVSAPRTEAAEQIERIVRTEPSEPPPSLDGERQSLVASAAAAPAAPPPAPARAVATPTAVPTEGPGWISRAGTSECPPDFPIKGNASSRRYHVPGQPSYQPTIPEICFADEQAAANRGFRPIGR
jgi:predicted flap endonuclease-1-like 5' DNA nuclease